MSIKILSPGPLNAYYLVVQWVTVKLMVILHFIIGSQGQSIEFTNSFVWSDIPRREPVFIKLSRDFMIDRGKCEFFSD